MLTQGDSGKSVTHYQERLKTWRSSALPINGADGDYGPETTQWVSSFQTTEDLPSTGNIDGLTAARLDSYTEDNVDAKLRRDLGAVQAESKAEDRAIRDECCGEGGGPLPDHTHTPGGVQT